MSGAASPPRPARQSPIACGLQPDSSHRRRARPGSVPRKPWGRATREGLKGSAHLEVQLKLCRVRFPQAPLLGEQPRQIRGPQPGPTCIRLCAAANTDLTPWPFQVAVTGPGASHLCCSRPQRHSHGSGGSAPAGSCGLARLHPRDQMHAQTSPGRRELVSWEDQKGTQLGNSTNKMWPGPGLCCGR